MRLGAAHGEDTSVMIGLSSRAASEWEGPGHGGRGRRESAATPPLA